MLFYRMLFINKDGEQILCRYYPNRICDWAFPWFDEMMEIAIKHASFRMFVLILYMWNFYFEEREKLSINSDVFVFDMITYLTPER